MSKIDTSAAAVERLAKLIAMHGDDQDTAALAALLAERDEAIDQRDAADFVLALSIEQSNRHSVERDEARAEVERLREEVAARVAAARREKIEAAAKWHDEQARMLRDPAFYSLPAAPGKIICEDRARVHEKSAAAVRALLEDGR